MHLQVCFYNGLDQCSCTDAFILLLISSEIFSASFDVAILVSFGDVRLVLLQNLGRLRCDNQVPSGILKEIDV